MADRAYTYSDLDAAIAAISEPGRLRQAQDLVSRAAPSLYRVLDTAIDEGGWFDSAHQHAVREAAGGEDPQMRIRAVQTLIAQEMRLGMLVGVAVGFELARELGTASGVSEAPGSPETSGSPDASGSSGAPDAPTTTTQTQED